MFPQYYPWNQPKLPTLEEILDALRRSADGQELTDREIWILRRVGAI